MCSWDSLHFLMFSSVTVLPRAMREARLSTRQLCKPGFCQSARARASPVSVKVLVLLFFVLCSVHPANSINGGSAPSGQVPCATSSGCSKLNRQSKDTSAPALSDKGKGGWRAKKEAKSGIKSPAVPLEVAICNVFLCTRIATSFAIKGAY